MRYTHNNQGVCSRCVNFDLEEGKVSNVEFIGGCPGNLLAIGKLVEGMDAEDIIAKLKGNTCGPKPTSCADQLAQALEKALEHQKTLKENPEA